MAPFRDTLMIPPPVVTDNCTSRPLPLPLPATHVSMELDTTVVGKQALPPRVTELIAPLAAARAAGGREASPVGKLTPKSVCVVPPMTGAVAGENAEIVGAVRWPQPLLHDVAYSNTYGTKSYMQTNKQSKHANKQASNQATKQQNDMQTNKQTSNSQIKRTYHHKQKHKQKRKQNTHNNKTNKEKQIQITSKQTIKQSNK